MTAEPTRNHQFPGRDPGFGAGAGTPEFDIREGTPELDTVNCIGRFCQQPDANEETVMGRRLYVGNLPYTTGEAELQELFSKAGTVETVRVMRDAATGRARGFAFVEMATDEEAQKAATEFNQYQMGGRSLTVNEARPKPEFSGGGGGGGGFGGNRGGGRREPRW